MPRALVLIVAALLITTGTATAGKKKKTKPKQPAIACSSEMSCARKCSAKNPAACDRLFAQLDGDLETWRHSPDIQAHKLAIHTVARANLPAACSAKQVRSCVLLGRLEEQGLGGPQDVTTAQERFTKACDAGEAAGCFALGTAYSQGSFGGKVPKLAYAAFEKGCKAGFQDACAQAGLMKADGTGTEKDLEGGIDAIEEACIKKSGLACAWLASLTSNGFGSLDGGATEVARFNERACELGHVTSCFVAADVYAAAPSLQLPYYEHACKAGSALGCAVAADAARADDPDRARVFEERACALGDWFRCDQLAQVYRNDAKNRDKYLAYLEATCDAEENSYSCMTLILVDLPEVVYDDIGVASLKRKPKKGEVEKVLARLEALCDRVAFACEAAAEMLDHGLYIKRDRVRARKLAQKACEAGGACSRVEALDLEIALEVDAAACGKDDLQACMRWGDAAVTLGFGGAEVAFDKACKGGVQDGCYAAAHRRLWSPETGDLDPKIVEQIMGWCRGGVLGECRFAWQNLPGWVEEASRKGCDLGDHESCTTSGGGLEDSDPAQALVAYERGCALDATSSSCAQIPPLRDAKQIADETAGCKANKPDSCLALGNRVRSTDPVAALAAFDRACTAKRADGCYGAGMLRTNDPTRQLQDLDKACELGSFDGCKAAGAIWLVSGDQAKARVALTKACLGGNSYDACVEAAPLWRADPADKDHVQLFAVLDRSCAYGDAAACEERQYPNGRPAGEVDSGYSSYRPSSGPRKLHLRLDVGAFQISPRGTMSTFEAYNGGAIGVGARTRRALGSGMFGLVIEGRGALSYGQESDLGYDGNGVVGLGIGRGGVAAEVAGVVGYDAMGETPAPATAFGLEGTYYYGWEVRARASFGARFAAGFSYASLGRQSEVVEQEKRLEFTLSRRNDRGGGIGVGVRTVAYDDGGIIGGFLRIDR